jgi:hypothetical protein
MDDIWGEELEKGDLLCFSREGYDHLFGGGRALDSRTRMPHHLMVLGSSPREGRHSLDVRRPGGKSTSYYHFTFIQKVTGEKS